MPAAACLGGAMSDRPHEGAHHIIRTPEALEELAQKDPNAVVLAGYVGVPRPAGTLYEMKEYGHNWIFPAVVIATGTQVRAARETLEENNE